jgi:hypothetical protein
MHRIQAIAVAACACVAQADLVTYSNWNTLDDVAGSAFFMYRNPGRTGIAFQASTSGDITSVAVPMRIMGSVTRSLHAEIWTVDANSTPQTIIAIGQQTISGLYGISPVRIDIDFQFPAAIEAGTMYALTLHTSGPTIGMNWHGSTLDPQGMVVGRLPGDIWRVKSVTEAGGMPAAQIFVTPTPTTLALLALAALPTRRRRA